MQIGPEHGEGEHELAQVVHRALAGHGAEGLFLAEAREEDHEQAQGRQDLPHHEHDAPDGREPVRVQGHGPVHGGEGDGEAEEHEAEAAQASRLALELEVGAGVEAPRPAVHEVSDEDPDREIEDGAGQEERRIEIGGLVTQERVALHDLGIGPHEEGLEAEDQGNEEHGQHGERPRARLHQAAHGEAPHPPREVVDQAEGEAAQGHPAPEEEGVEPAAEGVGGVQESEHDGQAEARERSGGGQPLEAVEGRRGHGKAGGGHGWAFAASSRALRWSAGTSSRRAFWLRCSTRTYAAMAQRSATGTWAR